MSQRQILSRSSRTEGFHLGLQPAPAWTAILGLIIFSALCILAHAGSIIRLAFPVGCFAVGVFLYWRYPILYLGFTWWVAFLTPWVRRLIDYQSGWVDPSPVLLAPYLVMLVTFATFVRHLPRAYYQGGLPFILAFTAVFYGFLVGLVNNSPIAVVRSLLDWLTPILFSFHLFVNWREYP
ncbi:MAG: O-antigen ligase domain-containing protein, partial [Coleofasciculus sp. S288]|nr:O-antigen ligase domain-containing protein [Coleofasciculus sp. S288]